MLFFDGCIEGYLVAGFIGFVCCPLVVVFVIGFSYLICKIFDYIDYCKKRKKVFDTLYPQYLELMKGEENHD